MTSGDDDQRWADAHLEDVDRARPLPKSLAHQIEAELEGSRPWYRSGDTESAGAKLAVLGLVASMVMGLGVWIANNQQPDTALSAGAAVEAVDGAPGTADDSSPAPEPTTQDTPTAVSLAEACERFRGDAYEGIDRRALLITTGVASFLDDPLLAAPALAALHGALGQFRTDAEAVAAPLELTQAAARALERASSAIANYEAGSNPSVTLGQVSRQLDIVDQQALGEGVLSCT